MELPPPHRTHPIRGNAHAPGRRRPHAVALTDLALEALDPCTHPSRGGPGGWTILDEPELRLGPDVVTPELAGWTRARLPEVPRAPFLTLAPDWVAVHVTSPHDRAGKLRIYARERVAHVWLVDPILRTLEVLRLDARGWVTLGVHRDDAVVRAEPFEAMDLPLSELWAAVEPPPSVA